MNELIPTSYMYILIFILQVQPGSSVITHVCLPSLPHQLRRSAAGNEKTGLRAKHRTENHDLLGVKNNCRGSLHPPRQHWQSMCRRVQHTLSLPLKGQHTSVEHSLCNSDFLWGPCRDWEPLLRWARKESQVPACSPKGADLGQVSITQAGYVASCNRS